MEKARNQSAICVRLEVLSKDGDVLYGLDFQKQKVVIGRILSADLRIDNPRVSRIHALVEIRGNDLTITDLASSHGTFVNDERIVEKKLKFGDMIRLGTVDVRVLESSEKAVAAAEDQPTGGDEATLTDNPTLTNTQANQPERRKQSDRRSQSTIPEENRLTDRRDGDRRSDRRKSERRKKNEGPPANKKERRTSGERRKGRNWERRVGERRKGDRRVFDITSLERRIDDRRARRTDGDVLPEELESAFEIPDHARELEVTVLWGDHILDVSNYVEPTVLTAGEHPSNTYIIPSVGIPEEFPIVRVEEDGNAYLSFTDEMTGTVRARDEIYDLDALKEKKFVKRFGEHYSFQLKQEDFAKISIGDINFFILYVKPAPRVKPAPLFERDKLLLKSLIGSALLMLFLFVGLMFVPEPKPVTIEMIPERFAKIVIRKRPKIPDVKQPKAKPIESGSKKAQGGKPKKPEARATKPKNVTPKAKPKSRKAKAKKAKKTVKKKTRRKRKVVTAKQVKKVGLLEAFSNSGLKKNIKNMLDKDAGVDAFDKGLRSSRGRVSGGAAGQGLKGVSVGGGGKTIGIDGPSTKGLGGGASGSGIGEGLDGPGRLGRKGEHSVSVISENVQVLSGLPKDVINRIVQRHRGEVRQCYEAARRRNPAIRGKVVVAFNIQPNGVVSYAAVKSSTVGDRALASCIVSRVKTWRFPKPEAPVVTEVGSYPFYLNPGN